MEWLIVLVETYDAVSGRIASREIAELACDLWNEVSDRDYSIPPVKIVPAFSCLSE